jgi:hypothetical protein
VKLLATEIDAETVQLTYTDGPAVTEAKQILMIRMPVEGPMSRPVLWHQLMILRSAQNLLELEARRVREELERSQ